MAESVHPQTGIGPDATGVYALGSSRGESARLQRQADELAADSAALLDRVGLRPGQSAIDLGCGPRGIVDLLAGRVSPGGRVVGLDADAAHTAMAADFAASQGLGDVEIMTADARRTGLPSASFDLVHARTLLVNCPRPRGTGRRDGAAGPPGRLGSEHGTRHRVLDVLSAAADVYAGLRDLPGGLRTQPRRPADRPPGAGVVPPSRTGRCRDRSQGTDVPAG